LLKVNVKITKNVLTLAAVEIRLFEQGGLSFELKPSIKRKAAQDVAVEDERDV